MKRLFVAAASAALLAVAGTSDGHAQAAPPIKIGQTMAWSGGASAYSAISQAQIAFIKDLNERGGINGRKIEFISLDDGYAPPKTVEQTRRLVEQDEVLFIFNPLGTATSLAVQKYLNGKGIPQLFIGSGNSGWNDPKRFPWTMGFQPSYYAEGRVIGKYIARNMPDAKVGLLHQADDFGKDYLKGLREGLGESADRQLVKVVGYQPTDPTIDSQIVDLRAAGVDTFVNITVPKYTAQAIRKVAQLGWKPTHFVSSISVSVGSVMIPAGIENGIGIIATAYQKDPDDPQWADDPAIKEWIAFMDKHLPQADKSNASYLYGYTVSLVLVELLKACGNDLSRANIMKQAANLDLPIATLLPGIKVKTSPDNFAPLSEMQLARFDGKTFKPFGDVISARD